MSQIPNLPYSTMELDFIKDVIKESIRQFPYASRYYVKNQKFPILNLVFHVDYPRPRPDPKAEKKMLEKMTPTQRKKYEFHSRIKRFVSFSANLTLFYPNLKKKGVKAAAEEVVKNLVYEAETRASGAFPTREQRRFKVKLRPSREERNGSAEMKRKIREAKRIKRDKKFLKSFK